MELAPSANDGTGTAVRHHRVDGTYNLRDTGGYTTPDGTTRWGKLFRSDALHRLTDVSRERFAGLGIGIVLDLRDESELLSAPSRLDGLDVEVVHAPIYLSVPQIATAPNLDLTALYRAMISDHRRNLVAAVRHIARSGDRAVLVHCTAGKDRTGLVVALALLAAGVSRDEVIADYAETEQHLRGEWVAAMLERLVEHGFPQTPEVGQLISASPPELLAATLDTIEQEYGSVPQYLLANGLEPDDLDALHAALVEPATDMKESTK